MARKPAAKAAQVVQPLTPLQRQAAALLADGAADDRVAAELGVPLAWVHGLQGSLPVTAEVVHQQWRRYRAHGQRIRSLVEQALDVVETELAERPSPDLAVALLRALKVEAPLAPLQSPEQMLRAECTAAAEAELRDREAAYGLGYGVLSQNEVSQRTLTLLEERAHRLSAPADPEPAA
jgi:hypothetical protein